MKIQVMSVNVKLNFNIKQKQQQITNSNRKFLKTTYRVSSPKGEEKLFILFYLCRKNISQRRWKDNFMKCRR